MLHELAKEAPSWMHLRMGEIIPQIVVAVHDRDEQVEYCGNRAGGGTRKLLTWVFLYVMKASKCFAAKCLVQSCGNCSDRISLWPDKSISSRRSLLMFRFDPSIPG